MNIKKYFHGWNSDVFNMWTDYKDCRVFQPLTKQSTWTEKVQWPSPSGSGPSAQGFQCKGWPEVSHAACTTAFLAQGTSHTRTVGVPEGQRARTSLSLLNSITGPCSWIRTCMWGRIPCKIFFSGYTLPGSKAVEEETYSPHLRYLLGYEYLQKRTEKLQTIQLV